MANIAHALVGQTLQVHTAAGQFAGTLEALIGGVLRIRGGGTVYDVDLAHVAAFSYPAPVPAFVPVPLPTAPPASGMTRSTAPFAASDAMTLRELEELEARP